MCQKPVEWVILFREALWEKDPLRWLLLVEAARLSRDGLAEFFRDNNGRIEARITPKGREKLFFLKLPE